MATPLIVNLFGGPGAGKSTARAGAFHLLKMAGINVEEVTEFAKDLTWEKRTVALSCQPYVFGKQLRNMERLFGQVDVIITDSPILLSAFYGRKYCGKTYSDNFYRFVEDHFRQLGGLNYLLTRCKPYNPKGRNQTAEEAVRFDADMKHMLTVLNLPVTEISGNGEAPARIFADVMRRLSENTFCPHGGPYYNCPDCP